MTPAELVRDIEKVSETLVLAVGALERLSLSLREPMERPDTVGCPTVDPPPIPVCTCRCCREEQAEGKRP